MASTNQDIGGTDCIILSIGLNIINNFFELPIINPKILPKVIDIPKAIVNLFVVTIICLRDSLLLNISIRALNTNFILGITSGE
ncbi:hypothetical protein ND00_11210 [Clostridium sp. L74]|nr:hypothetical protein ND00_11210 [Clostridium sp. L74]